MPRKLQGLPSEVQALLSRAQREKNPRAQYECLMRAREMDGGNLAIEEALLMLGNLWQRNARQPDPRLVKCYLFHAFEHPEAHAEEDQRRMARELFDHPQLARCISLTEKPDEFLKRYLMNLSAQYLEIFIRGQRGHVPFLFGFVPPKRLPMYLAVPMGDVIRNIFLCPFLAENEQRLLAGAFYRACYQHLDGQTDALDADLGASIRALIQ